MRDTWRSMPRAIDVVRLWPTTPIPWLAALAGAASLWVLIAIRGRGVPIDLPIHLEFVLASQTSGDWLPNWLFYRGVSLISTQSTDVGLLTIVALGLLAVAATAKYALTAAFLRDEALAAATGEAGVDSTRTETAAIGLSATTALALQVAFSLPVAGWTSNYYVGQLPPNVWHNSTTMVLMPFALALWLIALRYLRAPSVTLAIGLAALAILNVLTKPSFFMSFAIAYPVFVLVRHHWSRWTAYAAGAVAAPALLMAWQAIQLFGDADSAYAVGTTVIDPLFVWNSFSTNPALSLLASVVFPLAVACRFPRAAVRSLPFLLAAVNFVVSLAIFMLLAETGPRALHGNYSWQAIVGNYLLFTAAAAIVLRAWFERRKLGIADALVALALGAHVVSGVLYIVRTLSLGTYF